MLGESLPGWIWPDFDGAMAFYVTQRHRSGCVFRTLARISFGVLPVTRHALRR